ncbi:hypothetical protein COW36_13150 [bacterium (Candidatus Blackallbacteria) CG17_big_fil_post_rev_8_21_14_2_50_48_46]|uniref:Uncharacterized protein n=1 Tax=bacterium (Candidatus Blackallbacteria) CG17_big_fil_post_rev_8_21_14_2_50_48_46 TaxID=2014261 RepID=A0A2M7G491_9BACT|nr:MAG: hypothetical protein COW64_02120 [bacterium (Candidatus Blackallbacteria) CG18_big_fil_WC_8_21_14_2_50_49_26]PIW16706.1 MAG: hypothetical protein COW36_13150 [bacterium (Candidatus Blackallbacteria) CG17_big_fil_post_rev_8_21_14_2_50_48_46]PIW46212.1 MAG: hypothetical protein COW20_18400 [bacterium (Candidatus Blackallbacteria) CG13_big_fil_rev_8_21_14_2_50_49_14]
MKQNNPDQQIPCIIENGIVYGLKDIYRIIRDMGHVRYAEVVDDHIRASGEGYIMSVVANHHSATVIANRRIYLNVCGFDYMTIRTEEDGQVHFELVDARRTLRLSPATDLNPEDLSEEKPVRFEEYSPFEPEEFAEIQLDDDDDFMDGD